jgi:hypothetical protein
VTTFGVLTKDAGSWTHFAMVDLDAPIDPVKGQQIFWVACNGCPMYAGATYRGRLTPAGTSIYSILLDGTEILGSFDVQRADQLRINDVVQYYCPDQPAHYENVDGVATCVAGAPKAMTWGDGDRFAVGATATCATGFPEGFYGYVGGGNITVNVQLSSAYDLEDPELAHEVFPQYLIDRMNNVWTAAHGVPADHPYALADGLPHLYVKATLTHDASGDHYGMDVTVSGPKDRAALGAGGSDAVQLFAYQVPAVYTSAEKLTDAAAVGAVELLAVPGGWSCENGVAVPRETRKRYCADNTDNAALQASPLCTIE